MGSKKPNGIFTRRGAPLLLLAIVISLVAGVLMLTGCGGGSAGDAKTLYEKKCGSCHGLSTVDNAAYKTAEEWKPVVERMKNMTTSITDDDAKKITDYLASK